MLLLEQFRGVGQPGQALREHEQQRQRTGRVIRPGRWREPGQQIIEDRRIVALPQFRALRIELGDELPVHHVVEQAAAPG